MATDSNEESEEIEKKGSRTRHMPEHASSKHERAQVTADNAEDDAPGIDDTEEHVDMHDEEADDEAAGKSSADVPAAKRPAGTAPHRKLWVWVRSHRALTIPAAVVVALAVLAAVPVTRYTLAGMVIRKNFGVLVIDSQTQKPVTSALVTLEGKTATTNNMGVATVHVNAGKASLSISKKYYTGVKKDVLVPIGKQKGNLPVYLKATGRLVPVTVTNIISGKPVANISITASGAEAKTDAKGEAMLVLPAGKPTAEATIKGNGYNNATATIKVTPVADPANKIQVTPAGKVYFLSDKTGSLDVVKTNLDGTERQTVLGGSGKEDKPGTILLASRDWKYVALLSKRDGGDNPKLFLIDTSNDQVITMDEGNATFAPHGWSGHRFIYTVSRTKVDPWSPKRQALKSYDATSHKITLLDETSAQGNADTYATEFYNDVYILDQEILALKAWNGIGYAPPIGDKQHTILSVQSDGSQKKVVKSYAAQPSGHYAYVESRFAEFNEVYIRYFSGETNKSTYDEYAHGKVSAASDITDDTYNNRNYFTYIVSPSGNKTFWTDYRDGKNLFFVGDASGENGKQFDGSSEDYNPYGWFTDDYVLVTKKNSEMHIMPADRFTTGVESSLKVSDYYKPNYNNRGYGYGYGG